MQTPAPGGRRRPDRDPGAAPARADWSAGTVASAVAVPAAAPRSRTPSGPRGGAHRRGGRARRRLRAHPGSCTDDDRSRRPRLPPWGAQRRRPGAVAAGVRAARRHRMSRAGLLRTFATIGAVIGLVIGPAAAAPADDELDRYLAEAPAADYSGTAVVVSSWAGPGGAVVEIYKSGSTLVVELRRRVRHHRRRRQHARRRRDAADVRVVGHRHERTLPGGEGRQVVVVGRPASSSSHRGRPTRAVLVTVDEATGAVLSTSSRRRR